MAAERYDMDTTQQQDQPKRAAKDAIIPIETHPAELVATIDVRDASPEGLALMRKRVEIQTEQLKVAIKLTSPSQWVVFSGKGPNGEPRETLYPEGGAADTILRRVFGLTWSDKAVIVAKNEQGEFVATSTAWLTRNGVPVEEFTGSRRMGRYVKTIEDMKKGAIENMKSVAVRDLLGLRGRTPAEMQGMGLDVGRLERRAEFENHAEAGAAPTAAALVPCGKTSGQPVTTIDDGDLAWHIKAARENIADPAKARFRAKTERWLAACLAEEARRKAPPPPAPTGDHAAEKAELTAKIKVAAAVAGITDAQITSDLAACKSMAMARALLAKVQAAAQAAAQAATKEPVEDQTE